MTQTYTSFHGLKLPMAAEWRAMERIRPLDHREKRGLIGDSVGGSLARSFGKEAYSETCQDQEISAKKGAGVVPSAKAVLG